MSILYGFDRLDVKIRLQYQYSINVFDQPANVDGKEMEDDSFTLDLVKVKECGPWRGIQEYKFTESTVDNRFLFFQRMILAENGV